MLTIYAFKTIEHVISWWRRQMETLSASLAICAGNSHVPVNSPHKGQWRGALMFSLIYVWINDWVNNREAGDLRRYRTHYDVIEICPEMLAMPMKARTVTILIRALPPTVIISIQRGWNRTVLDVAGNWIAFVSANIITKAIIGPNHLNVCPLWLRFSHVI